MNISKDESSLLRRKTLNMKMEKHLIRKIQQNAKILNLKSIYPHQKSFSILLSSSTRISLTSITMWKTFRKGKSFMSQQQGLSI